jgi:hypothetical protein
VGLLALSSLRGISKLQNLNGDERFDSRRLHHVIYYQSFKGAVILKTTALINPAYLLGRGFLLQDAYRQKV